MEGEKLIRLVRELFDRHGLRPKESSVIGDLADLVLTSSDLETSIQRILAIDQEGSENATELGEALTCLHARVMYMQSVCRDLAEPLEELAEELAGPEGIIEALVGGVSEKIESFPHPGDDGEGIEN